MEIRWAILMVCSLIFLGRVFEDRLPEGGEIGLGDGVMIRTD